MVIHGGRDCPVIVRADPFSLACGGCGFSLSVSCAVRARLRKVFWHSLWTDGSSGWRDDDLRPVPSLLEELLSMTEDVSGGPHPRWNQMALTDALSDLGGLAAALAVMES